MSGGTSFGTTITGGIQDVAGLLPLLGTGQCEEHIGSALTGGYLYSAAAPMSLFGSLGVARAGFKTLIACISGRTWSGASILANMGFEPTGINLSLVMIDKDDKDGRHLAETRLDKLVKELHIDPSRLTVSHKCTRWNVTMILITAFLSSLSVISYIHLNHGGSNLAHSSQWTFPILRAVGGFLTASMMQIVLERRISRLTASHLAKFKNPETLDHDGRSEERSGNQSSAERPPAIDVAQGSQEEAFSNAGARRAGHDSDVEKGLGVPDTSDPANDSRPEEIKAGYSISSQHDTASGRSGILDWIFFILLLAGILSSVVGYVGCFSVVQNAKSHAGPLSWLCLEAGLSVIRMILWGLNPKSDDAPPLELVLGLDHNAILPTCNQDSIHIWREVLPLTRSYDFLNLVTSFAGLIERFTHPDLTLYYTLTRNQRVTNPEHLGGMSSPDGTDEARFVEPLDVAGFLDEADKRVLYITLFDHKERTTRVYTQHGTTEHFYSTDSDVPFIDVKHGLLETKLGNEIVIEDDVIAGDPEIHVLLRKHYQSVMEQIHFTVGETHGTSTSASPPLPPIYTIENKWTMKAIDTVGARERSRREETLKLELGRTWQSTVESGRTIEVDRSHPTFERDRLYLKHGRIEEMRRSLDTARGQWINRYMELVTRETRDRLEDETTAVRRVDGGLFENEIEIEEKAFSDDVEPFAVVKERGLINERCLMEKLLVYEVEAWEGLVWNRVKEFLDRDDVPEYGRERLTREWRGNCWKRLDANIRAMNGRMERAEAEISASPSNEWQSNLKRDIEEAHFELERAWDSVIEHLIDAPTPSVSSTGTPGTRFNEDIRNQAEQIDRSWRPSNPVRRRQERRQHQETARRLEKELADVEFRLAQGLDRCDQFFDDECLLECRHSRSKSQYLHSRNLKAPLDLYSRALRSNHDLIHIDFGCRSDKKYAWFLKIVCDLPSVTSMKIHHRPRPRFQRDIPLFIDDYYVIDPNSLQTFLDNDASLARTRDTYVFMPVGLDTVTIAVSFVGPLSGSLILRLMHRARSDTTLTILGTPFTLTIPESLTIDDINLDPIGSAFSQLLFVPNTRNNLILKLSSSSNSVDDYILQDLQLLDEDGNLYGQPSRCKTPPAELDALIMPDENESN